MSNLKPRAVQLVEVVEKNGRMALQLVMSTVALLASFPAPLYVLCVAGVARKGKSTILNLHLPKEELKAAGENCFKVSNKSVPETKGIWMWGRPLSLPNGQKGSLILLDCEGSAKQDPLLAAKLGGMHEKIKKKKRMDPSRKNPKFAE